MKRSWICAALLVLGSTALLQAQSPRVAKTAEADTSVSYGHLQPTPEMWFYDKASRDYNNPKAAVRRKAEYDTAMRQQRIAAMAWYGISNSRPCVYPTPHMGGTYSPVWGSNTRDPQRWTTSGTSALVLEVPPVVQR